MGKHELRVENFKVRVEIKNSEFKSSILTWRVHIHELQVQIHELRVQIYEFKNHLINENSNKQP